MKQEIESEFSSQDDLWRFCRVTASIIGQEVSPAAVRRIIDISNQGGHLFHGIKGYSSLESVRRLGILPFTPEGGYVSFWTSGFQIFGSSLEDPSPSHTYDTTFFHYGHAYDPSRERRAMLIALTNIRELERLGLDTKTVRSKNAYAAIGIPLPRNSIVLLRAETSLENKEDSPKIEKTMLELIEKTLVSGYELGSELSVEL
ncbi:hypothetical protein M1615_01015 [Patescibacteria group bacterium]|nr:hypothetical protein [Patescibacteria group bacterium]MCL5010412.1 hypothetical protein [Patescibacteria group bacterium]